MKFTCPDVAITIVYSYEIVLFRLGMKSLVGLDYVHVENSINSENEIVT